MLAALITMGVVACTEKEQEVDKTPEPAPEVLSFEATIDGVIETRTDVVLDEQSGDWNTVWAGNEKLAVSDSSGAKYFFTNSKENKGLFSSSDTNVKSLIGKDVRIDLVHAENGKKEIDSRAGKSGGSLVAEVKGFNPEERVSLSVESAFLRYSSAFEVTLQASQAIFMYDKSTHTALALPAGEDVWVAVKSCDAAVTVSCSIGGVNCLEQELNIEKKGLYNLGTLTPAPGAVSSVYFVPNEDWKSDDAWFAAYVWNEAGDNSSIVLGDTDGDGVYECALPTEMTNIIFCRMNPAYTEFAWNSETEGDHVWNQTEDLTVGVAPNNYFYITGWTTGEWHEAGYSPENPDNPTTEPTAVYFVPNDGWKSDEAWFAAYMWNAAGDNNSVVLVDEDEDGIYECEVPAGVTGLIFCRMNPAYTEFAWNSETEADHVWNQTEDLTVGVEPNNYFYITGWATGEWHEAGFVPETPDTPVVETTAVYFVPNNDWKGDEAWFAAYMWNATGDNNTIVLADEDEDGIYECEIPTDVTGLIFCRMNPAYAEFAWNSETEGDHVWNQTEDLTVGVEPNNYFYITGWATGEWHEAGFVPETPVVEAIVWSLAGSFNEWGDAIMEATELENLYVVKGLELKSGDEIKVKDSKTWETSYGGGITNLEANKWMKAYLGGANVVVAASGTYDVYFEYAEAAEYSKIYLVEMDGDYTLAEEQTANGTLVPDEPENPDQPVLGEPTKYGVVGTFQGWDVANSVVMVTAEDGWVVARGVELYKDDEIKIVEDKSWSVSYGLGTLATLDVDVEYVLNKGGQNIACAKNGRFDIYFKASEAKFKYTCVEEYADLTVNISINNKANWNPLRILLKSGDTLLTAAEGDVVTGDSFAVSGDYIGSTLTYQFFTDGKQSEPANINITKNGATVTLEETIIKLIFKLDTDNSKQYWGTTAKIHVWNTGTSFDTSWPGNAMTYDGDHTWHIIVPSELVGKTINYLVHNGNGWQSKDSKVTINAAGNTVTGSSIGVN